MIGCWYSRADYLMLEARQLSNLMQQDQSSRVWSLLAAFVLIITLGIMTSMWIGANFEAPPLDKSQEKMADAHAKVLISVKRLSDTTAADQVLSQEIFEQIASLNAPLLEFGQFAANGLRLETDSKDTLTWPGKVNVILDDLKIVSAGGESLLSYSNLRELLIGIYKPKGPINPKQLTEGSAGLGFFKPVSDLAQAGSPDSWPVANPKLTWIFFAKEQPKWREISAQLDALELEATQTEVPARAKMAKDLVALLARNDLIQSIRKADGVWPQIIQAQERLHAALEQLPPEPKVIIPSSPWHWSRLAFPGTTSEGLLACVCLIVLGLAAAVAGHMARRNQLRLLSARWLSFTQQLEAAVRSVDAPLVNAVSRIEALSAEFSMVTEKLKNMQQAITSSAGAPPKTLEEQAWEAASRMQAELEGDLNLLREKLFNIHLQFCNGQTHENLVYDLAFTTEAVQTVIATASDLGRSVSLLKDNLQQVEVAGDGQEIEALIGQVNGLRNSAKRIALTLQELSARLQVAVEDVPKGRRFEADARPDETGRLSVNQPI